MNSKLVIVITAVTIAVGAVVFGYHASQSAKIDRSKFQQRKLTVVSYPAFISSYGPGPELARRFKERTGLEVELVNGGDPSLIVQRLKSDPKVKADVLIGIDQLLAKKALDLKWKTLPKDLFTRVQQDLLVFEDSFFLPIDWSPLTMIYRGKEKAADRQPIAGVADFLQAFSQQKLALEDPRSSVLGQQWLYWFDQQELPVEAFAAASPRVANSWSQAYGLFKRESVDVVFSYMTSVIFHWEKEKDRTYRFLEFESGHPFQVDAAGVLDRCTECDAAVEFLEFLLEPGTQAFIMQKNFMLPAIKDLKPSGMFAELPTVKLISYDQISEFQKSQKEIEERYLKSLK